MTSINFAHMLIKACTACAVTFLSQAPLQAQALIWDWGGEKKVNGSGREAVRMAAAKKPGDIIVSFSDRKLYFVTKPGEALSYPIATPRERSRWQGTIAVTSKRENPSWTPTPTMRAENPKLPSWVPGGHPMNPLGIRALYLGSSTYRIHGTDAPWTIGSAISKGCVRMYNQDVVDLYSRVRVGASVLVTWDKFDPKSDHDGKTSTAADVPEPRTPRKTAERSTPSERTVDITTGSLSAPSAGGPETVVAPHSREDHEPPRPVRSRKRVVPPVVKKYVPPEEITI